MVPLSTIRTFLADNPHLALSTVGNVRRDQGLVVKTYVGLMKRVARLSFFNPGYSLFFRGQDIDYINRKGYTTIFPKIFRDGTAGINSGYRILSEKVDLFTNSYKYERKKFVTRDKYLLWAVLQHYQVCSTPLLDMTHSLSIGCSFSLLNNNKQYPVLYVLALPHLTGGVTVSHESQLLVIRLTNVCPPNAMRPYVQEAYVMGEYPSIDTMGAKNQYRIDEVNCAHRLLCKFRLERESFLSDTGFRAVHEFHKKVLFPDRTDDFLKYANNLK